MTQAENLISIKQIMGSSISDTGAVTLQLGSVTTGDVDVTNALVWSLPCIAYRPSNPTGTVQAADALSLRYGDTHYVVAGRDTLSATIAGNLLPGEVCVYAPGEFGLGQGRMLFKGTGAITIYTTVGNTEGGESMAISIDPQAQAISATIGQAGAVVMNTDGFQGIFGQSGFKFGTDGTIVLSGKSCMIGTQSVLLGLGASPGTPVCVGPVGQTAVGSKSVVCAP
jgi:hypothetical protein